MNGKIVSFLALATLFYVQSSTGVAGAATSAPKSSHATSSGEGNGKKAAVTKAPKIAAPAKATKRPVYKCTNCMGKGNDCKGAQQANCLYCMKIIGVVQGDPKDKVTQAFVSLLFPGIKAANYIGQEVTIRKCVTQMDLTTFNYPDNEGCGEVDDFSVKGYGCVCKDECKEPTSFKPPTSTARPTSAGPRTSAAASSIASTTTTKKPKN